MKNGVFLSKISGFWKSSIDFKCVNAYFWNPTYFIIGRNLYLQSLNKSNKYNILMANTSDLKNGIVINFNNELCSVLSVEHRTPGNLRAFYQVKLRNLKNFYDVSKIVQDGLDFLELNGYVVLNNHTVRLVDNNGEAIRYFAGYLL